MISANRLGIVVGLSVAALTSGCGGGGSANNDAGTGGDATLPGTGTLTWRDQGGAAHHATFTSASLTHSTMRDLWMITGSESGGYAVSFGVSTPPPLVAGTYTCGQPATAIVTLVYTTPAASWQVATCTINLMAVGVPMQTHSMGSFSSTLTEIGGTQTSMIDQGMFDAPVIGASL